MKKRFIFPLLATVILFLASTTFGLKLKAQEGPIPGPYYITWSDCTQYYWDCSLPIIRCTLSGSSVCDVSSQVVCEVECIDEQ